MRSDNYREYFKAPYLMGPNSLRLMEALVEACPRTFAREDSVLDLGCGSGLTSLFLAKETGAKVYANDLWVSEADNRQRFEAWGMADRITPVHEDATDLHFEPEQFEALFSVDAYHYFGGKPGFFAEKILPFIKKGGVAMIAVPGMRGEFDGRSEELVSPWLGDEAYMFQSAAFWKRIIGEHEDIAGVETWELSDFDRPWQEWFDTGHEFALNDRQYYDSIIRPYTAFIGIMVRKKG